MNRSFPAIFILVPLLVFVMAASAVGEANWVSVNGQTSPEKPSVVVLRSDANETVVKVTIHGFWSEDVTEDGVTYQALRLPDYAGTLDIGKAHLPVVSELIGVPGNAHVNVSILDSKETTLTGYNVVPFQKPLRDGEQRTGFDIDRAFYQQNAFYPTASASVGDPGIWRDLRVVTLKVNPLAFNPATKELKVSSEITVRLDYTGTSDINVKGPQNRPVTANYDKIYRGSVLNYDYLSLDVDDGFTAEMETDAGYDYLIIAADAYVDNMTPFIDWKNSLGITTVIIPISIIGATDNEISAYIANEYTNNGISYVLLVGNEEDVPGHVEQRVLSDYYYTLIEGNDPYADIAIGRFSVTDAAQVDNMVNKSINFASTPPDGDWLEKSLLVANWEYAPDKYQLCSEEIRTAAEVPGNTYAVLYPNFTTAYGASFENGGDEASNADVVNYFNEGFRLINYRGHGDEVSWQYWNVYAEYFRTSNVEAINNGLLTPVVFSIACLNNNILYGSTTLGEAFTQAEDKAVALLGATDPSYTEPNHDYDKALYAIAFNEGVNTIGDISNEASVRTIVLWGIYGEANANMYLWLGDPSLPLLYEGEPIVSCCVIRGDVNHDGQVTIVDINDLCAYLFRSGPAPVCMEEADFNNDGSVDIRDVDFFMDYAYRYGPAAEPCD